MAEQLDVPLKSLYMQVGWPLYRKYGHCYDAFKLVLTDQEDIFAGLEAPPSLVDTLTEYIKKKLAPQPIKVRAQRRRRPVTQGWHVRGGGSHGVRGLACGGARCGATWR